MKHVIHHQELVSPPCALHAVLLCCLAIEVASLSLTSGYLEKYWETKRELESLHQRLSTERDDELETLRSSKRSLEKKVNTLLIFVLEYAYISQHTV